MNATAAVAPSRRHRAANNATAPPPAAPPAPTKARKFKAAERVRPTPSPPQEDRKPSPAELSQEEGGVSEMSSGRESSCVTTLSMQPNQLCAVVPPEEQAEAKTPTSCAYHYASVNFRFGCAWFLAPFRCQPGDIVVVEYPATQSLHMGIVNGVTTEKPATFYSEGNLSPDYYYQEELETLPRLLRHARSYDKQSKLTLRERDIVSLERAQRLASEMGAPVQFIDAEWLLDSSALTFLVYVYGDEEVVNTVADKIAALENTEVVFTYPSQLQ